MKVYHLLLYHIRIEVLINIYIIIYTEERDKKRGIIGKNKMEAEKYGFVVDWYDRQADLIREYTLTYFVRAGNLSNEISMFDPKARRNFLKRAPYPSVRLDDLTIGSTVTVHARQLTVKGYTDLATKEKLSAQRGSILVVTKPDAYSIVGNIISCAYLSGLSVSRLRMVDENGPTVAIELIGNNVQDTWNKASNGMFQEGIHYDVSTGDSKGYFTDRRRYPTTATFDNCTLCVIRPTAIRNGKAGEIINEILNGGYEVSAMQMIHFNRAEAAELFEVYKGVLPYYSDILDEMTIAPSIALEVRAEGVIERMRNLAGPHDVELAQHIRPQTLRARYGSTNAANGVHVTDLAEDGTEECRYVFEILNR